ncbi:MAG: mechanosensitive ion channel [Methylacidiphilales bacterium]|nr:mechanosensitive ion channel [Candidatus Methylacidiphilales bacterium]
MIIADAMTLSDWKLGDFHYWAKLATDVSVIGLLTGLSLVLVEHLATRLANSTRVSRLALRPLLILARVAVLTLFLAILLNRLFELDFVVVLSSVLALIGVAFVAFWSVLSSVTCTFLLILFRPFKMGDHVEIKGEGAEGEVCDLNLLFTTLRAADDRLIQVPNNLFFQKVIVRRKGTAGKSLEEQLASGGEGK